MQCMMIWNHLKKTIPKILQTSLNLKNPKFFNNPQKLGHKRWNAWERSEKESYLRKEVILRSKREWGSDLEWERGVWEGEKSKRIERDQEKWEKNHADPIYRNLSFSMDWELSRIKKREIAIEELSRGVHNK